MVVIVCWFGFRVEVRCGLELEEAKNFYGGRDQPSAQFRYQALLG